MGWKDAPLRTAPAAARPKWAAAPLREAVKSEPDQRGVLARAASNAPESGVRFVKSIVDAFAHPVQTAETLGEVATGAVQHALPKGLQAASATEQRAKASAVADYFAQRYGGLEAAKETFATDPVGFVADAATVLTGGGGAVARVPGLAKAGQAVSAVGSAIDPINVAGKVAAPVANVAGRRVADAFGGLGTHTGGESVRQAFNTGREGGESGQTFRENMRGNVPATDVVEQARQAVANMRAERSAAYRSGMANVSKDQTVLDMQPIVDELNTQAAKGQYKGIVIDPSTAEVRQQINQTVVDWWKQDPAEFHTPEGLDALKKAVGDIRDSTEYGSPARTVADGVYHSIKQTITKQAPEYAKVMKDYENASEALREVERALSLGDKGRITADTALRKLQSIMRNNANTNYGARLKSAERLEQSGAETLRPALAGQAMNSWTPRGLGGLVAGGTGAMALATLNPKVLALLAAQSPRLVGEAAHVAGRATGAVAPRVGAAASPAGLGAYQADQLKRAALSRALMK